MGRDVYDFLSTGCTGVMGVGMARARNTAALLLLLAARRGDNGEADAGRSGGAYGRANISVL